MLHILLISFIAAPLMANPRFPRQFGGGFGPPGNAPSFGPNWGANQPWGQPPSNPPQPPINPPPPPVGASPPPVGAPPPGTDAPPAGQIFHSPPDNCPCPRTRQFNSVCGTDGNTYANQALLDCFISCGTQVSFRYAGNCRRPSG